MAQRPRTRRLAGWLLSAAFAAATLSLARLVVPGWAATPGGEAAAEGGDHGFLLLHQIPGLEHALIHVVGAVFAAIVVAIVAWVGTARIRSGQASLVPTGKFDLQTILEGIVGMVLDFSESIIGHDGRRYLPLLGTLALFILFCNLEGLLPGFLPPTQHLGTTAVLGLTVFVVTHVVGVKANGAGYVKHFLGPIWWLAPLMLVIEVISHLARPLSLSVRLFGNMYGDHQVFGLFSSLIPLVVPVLAMGLGLFVALIQTFVFCLLSMMYIAGAVAHDEH
ncbi:MAG TPA: F0F1 ATP synthase subunit A [Thermodesulfobacteriota bacterium]